MSKWIVDIHGEIEGDYEIIKKYEEQEPCEDTISRQDAINAIENTECELLPEEWDELTDAIMGVPSAQPEIIRCKDCKWKMGAECIEFAEVRPFPDDFCSRAERRTDDVR